MRICSITTTYPKFPGDTSAPFIADMTEGIAALGHSAHVVLPYHPQLASGQRNGVFLHPYRVPGDSTNPIWGYAQSMDADIKLKKKALFLAPFALRQTYKTAVEVASEHHCDLIHAHWVLPNGFAGNAVARKLKLPLVVSLHGSDMFLTRKSRFFGGFARSVLRSAQAVTACSPDLQEQAQKLSGRDVQLLEYGVDINHFAPSSEVQPRPYSVFTAGRLVYKKGFMQLLDAFAKIYNYYPDSTLTIAGSGPLLAKLKERSIFLGVEPAVNFPGNVDRNQLPSYFASSDVVVVPSVTDEMGNRDGLPNVFLEALSSGSAIVATDIPGIQNIADHRREALIVTAGDVDTMCDAILLLFQDPNLRAQLRQSARNKAVSELSWEAKCKQLESIYRQASNHQEGAS
jgi:glycosyltransferase involved in cell wall biosynthesis